MIVLAGARGAGKTYRVIQTLIHDPAAVMVCASLFEAQRVKEQHPELANRIYGPDRDTLVGQLGPTARVVVDNADWLLEQFLGKPIVAVTMTARAYELGPNPHAEQTQPL